MVQICSTCGEEKILEEDFHRDASKKNGFRNNCKECTIFNPNYEERLDSIKEKTCNTCKQKKPLEQFIRDERTTLGYGRKCIQCSRMKFCRSCSTNKPLEGFYRSKKSKDGYQYRCTDCVNARRREKYKKDQAYRERRKKENLRYQYSKTSQLGKRERILRKYNMTLEDYDTLLQDQDGVCAICEEEPETILNVDHDHDCCTGYGSCGECVRGLLCDRCNRGLGMLQDDIDMLQNAINYLSSSMAGYFG